MDGWRGCILWGAGLSHEDHVNAAKLDAGVQPTMCQLGCIPESTTPFLCMQRPPLAAQACPPPLFSQGQSSVDAVTAQIAFSAVPLWSALLAALLLPGDSALGPLTWAGGGCMVIAGIVGVLPPKPTRPEAKD